MGEKISKLVQKQNQCNSNEDEHTFEESPLGKSCEEVVIEVPSFSPELIDLVSYTSFKLVPTHFSCSPPSPPLKYLVKPMDDCVVTDLTNDLDLVDIEKKQLEGIAK